MNQDSKSNLERFRESATYKLLVKEHHQLKEYATWQVFGADPNCDMGGSHHTPSLGFFTGWLEDVIVIAVELPGFWQYDPGEIKKVKAVFVGQGISAVIIKLRAKEKELKELLAKVQKQLKDVGM